MLKRQAVAALWLLLGLSKSAVAGAFLWPEGRGQIIVTTTFASARKAYDARGRLIDTPRYDKFEARAYVEYGLAPWLTVVGEGGAMDFRGAPRTNGLDALSLLIAEAKARAPLVVPKPVGVHYRGLGLGMVGLRVKLLELSDYVVSAEASLRAASAASRIFLDMKDFSQIDARLQLGKPVSLLGVPGFVDAQIGYRSRGQNGDEARVDLTFGVRPVAWLMVLAQSFSAFAPGANAGSRIAAQKFQLSAVYDINETFSVQLGVYKGLLGVNSPAEIGILTALWARF